MPSVVNGEHMKAVKKYFDKLKIPVSGFFQWQLTLTLTLTLAPDQGTTLGGAGYSYSSATVANRHVPPLRHDVVLTLTLVLALALTLTLTRTRPSRTRCASKRRAASSSVTRATCSPSPSP